MPDFLFLLLKYYKIKYGEYLIAENTSLLQVLRVITSGRQNLIRIFIPEGWSVRQILDFIALKKELSGPLPDVSPNEGSLLPGTYLCVKGTSAIKLLNYITKQTQLVHDLLWKKAKNTWKSREEWVTVASILEKEGYDRADKETIAGVILNRLNKNMKLQIDATLLYSKTGGKYDSGLTWKELTYGQFENGAPYDTQYNTYLHTGLPPGPITNPSRESLEAAANPRPSNYLYYRLANGRHYFSTTFQEHKSAMKLAVPV